MIPTKPTSYNFHRRSSSGSDPFQNADVYYGEQGAASQMKNRRRALSSVRGIMFSLHGQLADRAVCYRR